MGLCEQTQEGGLKKFAPELSRVQGLAICVIHAQHDYWMVAKPAVAHNRKQYDLYAPAVI